MKSKIFSITPVIPCADENVPETTPVGSWPLEEEEEEEEEAEEEE